MADPIEGILGGFSGKVGTVVGVKKRGGGYYMRAKPRKKSKEVVQQEIQRSPKRVAAIAKFTFLNTWLKKSTGFFRVSFAVQQTNLTGMQAAFKRNWPAVAGEYPNYIIDHSKVIISGGQLPPPESASAIIADHRLLITWVYDDRNRELRGDDDSMVFLYFPELEESWGTTKGSRRHTGRYEETLPEKFHGHQAEVYLGFRSDDRERVSDSVYLGRVGV